MVRHSDTGEGLAEVLGRGVSQGKTGRCCTRSPAGTACRSIAEACEIERVDERGCRTSRLDRREEAQRTRGSRTGNMRHDRQSFGVGHGAVVARP